MGAVFTADPIRRASPRARRQPADMSNRAGRARYPLSLVLNPAWKLKPSWYMVAQADRIISPDLERMYAARAHRHTVEIGGASHSVYRSHPKEVASLIKQASLGAADPGAGRADAPTRTPRQ